jgi:hypothetical protein
MNKKKIKIDSQNLYEIWKGKLLNKPWIVIILFLFMIFMGVVQFSKGIKNIFFNESEKSKNNYGKLLISDIQVLPNRIKNSYQLDFRVSNNGTAVLLINKVKFEVLDIVTAEIKAYLGFSKLYDLDISDLEEIGDTITTNISQAIDPGESDRFGIIVIAQNIPEGLERGWRLLPTLISNYGEASGERIEIWFPEAGQLSNPGYFEEIKKIEKLLKSKNNILGGDVDSEVRADHIKNVSYNNQEYERLIEQLINEQDLGEMAKNLERLFWEYSTKDLQIKIVESEKFGKSFQQKIIKESNLMNITLCLDYLKIISERSCDVIIGYKDFGIRIFPPKLYDESDIDAISLCLMVLSNCRNQTVQYILEESRGLFDIKDFVTKINKETDVKKIGKCFMRINYVNPNFAKTVLFSKNFDLSHLRKKIKLESDIEKISECLVGISDVSGVIAQTLYDSLNPNIRNKLKDYYNTY